MRRQNTGQSVFLILSAVLIVALLAIGFGFVVPRSDGSGVGGDSTGFATIGGQTEPAAFEITPGPNTPVLDRRIDDEDQYSDDEWVNIRVYESRNEAVVNITTETVAYNWFLEPVPQEGTSGSGSIIDHRGFILTNHHVVKNAAKVFVTLAGGLQIEGTVVGSDPENDLAVIKIDVPAGVDLVTIPFSPSGELRIGQKVLAIGNPFGLDRTLTTGIVSGLGRPIRTSSDLILRDMIQTDASINPGNSGGPLLDMHGNMIGINTVIYSPSGGSVGIGFAIPIATAQRVVPDLIKLGAVNRGWIDIIPIQLFADLVRYADLPVAEGILVSQLVEGGNAEVAGIRGGSRGSAVRYGRTVIYLGGDVITRIDDVAVTTLANLYAALEGSRPGQRVTVEYYRGSQRRATTVVLSPRPQQFVID